ncbi:hypothetical protein ACJX0J_013882 [Zea mays]
MVHPNVLFFKGLNLVVRLYPLRSVVFAFKLIYGDVIDLFMQTVVAPAVEDKVAGAADTDLCGLDFQIWEIHASSMHFLQRQNAHTVPPYEIGTKTADTGSNKEQILLKQDKFGNAGIENNTQPEYCGDVEQDDYVGLGDMFNEPEVTSEVKKEAGKVEDIDVDDSNAPVSQTGGH